VSSYSYLIVPTTTASPFNAAKGITLSKFIIYLACAGQQEAAQLGYSPLPPNLVQDVFNVVERIPGHVNPPPLNQCDNPTITQQFLTGNAPPPPPTAKQGASPPPNQTTITPTPSNNGIQSGLQQTPQTNTSHLALGRTHTARGTQPSNAANPQPQTYATANSPVQIPPAHGPLPLYLYIIAAAALLLAFFAPPALNYHNHHRAS